MKKKKLTNIDIICTFSNDIFADPLEELCCMSVK